MGRGRSASAATTALPGGLAGHPTNWPRYELVANRPWRGVGGRFALGQGEVYHAG